MYTLKFINYYLVITMSELPHKKSIWDSHKSRACRNNKVNIIIIFGMLAIIKNTYLVT